MKRGILILSILFSTSNLFANPSEPSHFDLMAKWLPVALTTFLGEYPDSAAHHTEAIKVLYVGPLDQVNVIFVMGDKSTMSYMCTEHMEHMEGVPHCMLPTK